MANESVMRCYPIAGTILKEWVIPAKEYSAFTIRQGQTLRFVDIALAKEEELLDDVTPRLDVESIGEPVESPGLLLARRIDIQRFDGDLSDVQRLRVERRREDQHCEEHTR